jgi:hypothetical protein
MDQFKGLCGLVLSELRLAAAQASPKVSSEAYRVLSAPLVLLMNILPTASSPKLRQAETELCHAILVETRSVWDQEETSNVPRAAIECCIALFRDNDGKYPTAEL